MSLYVKTFEDVRRLVHEIEQRENILLDYKSGDNPKDAEGKDIAKDISSFANQSGGYLIYGVRTDDDGKPIEINGIADAENLRNKIIKSAAAIVNLNPPIFVDPIILEGDGKKVVVVNVDESVAAPHFYRGTTTFWVRGADHNNPIEGTPPLLSLLQNRRERMEKRRHEQLQESKNLSTRWLARAYHPHHKPVPDRFEISIPSFSLSLQPRNFDESFIDIRGIRDALEKALTGCRKKFDWPSSYYYAFFEDYHSLQSYALTYLSCWYADTLQENAYMPNATWTTASSTGSLFHFEDLPYKCPLEKENGVIKQGHAFDPIWLLRKAMTFLLFAKEYYSVLSRDASVDFQIECNRFLGLAPLYHQRPIANRRIIENHFIISRSFTTLELSQEKIEQLVISDIPQELLIDINYMQGHSFDLNEVNQIKTVLKGQ